MYVKQSFDDRFVALYNSIASTKKGMKFLELEGLGRKHMDVVAMTDAYFSERTSDVTVDANANANGVDNKSPNSLQAEKVKGLLKLEGCYLLWKELEATHGDDYANALLRKLITGDFYFHDLSGVGFSTYYCFAHSTYPLMTEGLPFGQLHSKPAKKAHSFIGQAIELMMIHSQEQMGAAAIADLLVNLDWFVRKEGLSTGQAVDLLQSVVHVANQQFRTGGQSPFINISLYDRNNLRTLFEHLVYPDGTGPDFDSIMRLQLAFGRWFAKGDPISGLPYRFPVVTVAFLIDEAHGYPLDAEFLRAVSEMNYKTGCFNIYLSDGPSRLASCCRLKNDAARLKGPDCFGMGGLNIGSSRVVTINMVRLALQAKGNRGEFITMLQSAFKSAADMLLAHRSYLKRNAEQGLLKFVRLGWLDIDKMLFCTFGIIGFYEACQQLGIDLKDETQREWALDLLRQMDEWSLAYTKEHGVGFNIEQIPGESAAVKLAQKDQLFFDLEEWYKIYSNQFIPLSEDVDLYDRVEMNGKLSAALSGGGITHLNVSERIHSPEVMEKIILFALQHGNDHFAINYGFGVCENEHVSITGTSPTCPICSGKIVKHMTRVVGYFTPVTSWAKGRRDEFKTRIFGSVNGGPPRRVE